MVDSEDLKSHTVQLTSIVEDNEYFKRMWSQVPSMGTMDTEPSEEAQDSSKVDIITKKAQKKKKREKRKRKDDSVNDQIVEEPTEKHSDTTLKQKRQKITTSSELLPITVKHKQVSGRVDTNPGCLKSSKSIAHTKSPVGHSVDVKHKHKHGQHGHMPAVHGDTEQIDKTVSSMDTAPSTSCVVTSGELSNTDLLKAASINNIEDKREKLRAKIAELQAKRAPTNQERLARKKLKRQESKMKLKQKRMIKKLQKNQNKQNGDSSKPSSGNLNKGVTTPVKPIYNKEGQMVFSKFDFTDSAKKEKKQSDLHGKDYKRLLEKIEKRNEKINKVKNKDKSAGKALEEKFKWESALHKAEGEKVKDNTELLKKALKRKQKMKDQKKKKWENRVNHVDKMKEDRQRKRNENIQKRKQSVKEKKMQKLKKKGRIIPGF